MPDADQTEPAADPAAAPEESDGPIISVYGVASAALGVLCVAAIALGLTIWTVHRSDVDERRDQSRVIQAAADWTGVLINMNSNNVTDSLQRLRDGTVGELNVDFDSAIQPYQQVVQRLQAHSTGRIDAIAIETVHQAPDTQPGTRRPAPVEQLPAGVARRTDNVMVVATSVSEKVGGKPQVVPWNLRLAVSDVDGKLMISQLESIK